VFEITFIAGLAPVFGAADLALRAAVAMVASPFKSVAWDQASLNERIMTCAALGEGGENKKHNVQNVENHRNSEINLNLVNRRGCNGVAVRREC
jgi:hypothetical protein